MTGRPLTRIEMVSLGYMAMGAVCAVVSQPRFIVLSLVLTAMTATGLVGVWLVCATAWDWWRGR